MTPIIRNDEVAGPSKLDELGRRLVALRVRLDRAKTDFQRGQADGVEAALAVLHEVQVGLPLGASRPADVPMSLVPTAALERLELARGALDAAFAVIAKRPAPVYSGGCAGHALHALDDVTTRPRVPGPAL